MLHFPDVQKRAQAELDAVVGHDRMPEFEDRDNLPYIRALINETLRCATFEFHSNFILAKAIPRWRPVAILGGTPHAVTADDVYNGM